MVVGRARIAVSPCFNYLCYVKLLAAASSVILNIQYSTLTDEYESVIHLLIKLSAIKKTSVFPKLFLQMGLRSFYSGICKTKIIV